MTSLVTVIFMILVGTVIVFAFKNILGNEGQDTDDYSKNEKKFKQMNSKLRKTKKSKPQIFGGPIIYSRKAKLTTNGQMVWEEKLKKTQMDLKEYIIGSDKEKCDLVLDSKCVEGVHGRLEESVKNGCVYYRFINLAKKHKTAIRDTTPKDKKGNYNFDWLDYRNYVDLDLSDGKIEVIVMEDVQLIITKSSESENINGVGEDTKFEVNPNKKATKEAEPSKKAAEEKNMDTRTKRYFK